MKTCQRLLAATILAGGIWFYLTFPWLALVIGLGLLLIALVVVAVVAPPPRKKAASHGLTPLLIGILLGIWWGGDDCG